jgi:hypothetical protein
MSKHNGNNGNGQPHKEPWQDKTAIDPQTGKKPRKPNAKTNRAEQEKRERVCFKMVADGYSITDIKRVMKSQYQLGWRAIINYIAKARAELRAESGMAKDDLVAASLGRYFDLYHTAQSIRDKTFINQRIDELLGLQQPKIIHAGTLGEKGQLVAPANASQVHIVIMDNKRGDKPNTVKMPPNERTTHPVAPNGNGG